MLSSVRPFQIYLSLNFTCYEKHTLGILMLLEQRDDTMGERVNARRARSKFARGKEQEDGIILLQTNLTRRPTNFVLHLSVVIVLFFYAKDNPQGK